jgi:hypothetical protein
VGGEYTAQSGDPSLMNEHLMAALLYAAAFFDTSTEIAYNFSQLSAAEQDEFRQFAYRLADSDPNPHVAADLRRVADGLLPLDTE